MGLIKTTVSKFMYFVSVASANPAAEIVYHFGLRTPFFRSLPFRGDERKAVIGGGALIKITLLTNN